jgi:hypothetical protein
MAAVAFDTLKCARRLKAAGYTDKQAEVQAEIMAEAFVFNMDALVTKDYLDVRFAEQEARIDNRFAEQDVRFDARFVAFETKSDARFSALDLKFTEQMGALRGEMGLHRWILAAIAASTVLPALNSLFNWA